MDERLYTLASAQGKRTVVALAVVQALLLLAFHEAAVREWAVTENLVFSAAYLALVVFGLGAAELLMHRPQRRRPWLYAGALGLALLLLALWAGSLPVPDLDADGDGLLPVYALTAALVWFISLAFLHADLVGRRLDYAAVEAALWHHGLALAVGAFVTGLMWAVLALWAALFDVLGIGFFEDVFYDRRFAYGATGLAVGVGIVTGRGQTDAVLGVQRVLVLVARLLLPLLALLALAFLAVLPFTGLAPLWDTGHAAALMLALMALTLLFLNGTVGAGRRDAAAPYPQAVRWLVDAALVTMPVYGALSAYALFLRVDQYGWTPERFWAAVVVGVLGAYALVATAAVFRRRGAWMQLLGPANLVWFLGVLAVLVLANTPLLSPQRISARDQAARLAAGAADAAVIEFLRFDAGRHGLAALRRLQAQNALTGQPRLAARLDTALARKNRYGVATIADATPEVLRAAIETVPDTLSAPPVLFSALAGKSFPAAECLQAADPCLLLGANLTGDARSEFVLFVPRTPSYIEAIVYTQADTDGTVWERTGTLANLPRTDTDALLDSLRAGHYRVVPSEWRDLRVGERRLRVQ